MPHVPAARSDATPPHATDALTDLSPEFRAAAEQAASRPDPWALPASRAPRATAIAAVAGLVVSVGPLLLAAGTGADLGTLSPTLITAARTLGALSLLAIVLGTLVSLSRGVRWTLPITFLLLPALLDPMMAAELVIGLHR